MTSVSTAPTLADRIILEPTVTVVISPEFHSNPRFPIPRDGYQAERAGSYAAKRCYRSSGFGGRPNLENQRAVIESRHGSVLQHLHFGLDIEGITRACSLELNRHDLDISQESTRYVDLEKHGRIVLEPFFAKLYHTWVSDIIPQQSDAGWWGILPDEANAAINVLAHHVNAQLSSLHDYAEEVKMLEALNPLGLPERGFDLRKWARGKARNVTPHGLETAGVWTGNLRMWRWVIELRSHRTAEPEVRRLAGAIYDALSIEAPVYFEDFTVTRYDGLREFTPKYSKI